MLSSLQSQLLWRLEDLEGVDGLMSWVPRLSSQYSEPRHLRGMVELFQRVEDEELRVCISVPPQHGKTETILHLVARYLARHPDRTVGYASYGAKITQKNSKRLRELAVAAGVRLKRDQNAAGEWRTEQGGGVVASSVGGALTGYAIHLLIVDDAHKNRQDAQSAAIRDRIYDWFTSTAMTRIQPGGSVIVNHTRWHVDDLIGRLTSHDEQPWESINLPALDADGNALWPEVRSAAWLDCQRRTIGKVDWASLYCGQPKADYGALFAAEPGYFGVAELAAIRQGARIVLGVDPAATASTSADYSVVTAVASKGVGVDQKYWVLEVWRGQVSVPDLARKVVALQQKWGNAPAVIEAVGGFKSVPQVMREIAPGLKIVETQPKGDKFSRAQVAAAAWEDGRVLVPDAATWLEPLLQELRVFTGQGDKHDDQVDALSYAVNALVRLAPAIRVGARAVVGA